jgi:hypothetical protein
VEVELLDYSRAVMRDVGPLFDSSSMENFPEELGHFVAEPMFGANAYDRAARMWHEMARSSNNAIYTDNRERKRAGSIGAIYRVLFPDDADELERFGLPTEVIDDKALMVASRMGFHGRHPPEVVRESKESLEGALGSYAKAFCRPLWDIYRVIHKPGIEHHDWQVYQDIKAYAYHMYFSGVGGGEKWDWELGKHMIYLREAGRMIGIRLLPISGLPGAAEKRCALERWKRECAGKSAIYQNLEKAIAAA